MDTIALIADSAQPAAPPLAAGSAANDLRRELADALADREAADKAARIAADIANRANRAKDEAAREAARLKQDLDRVQAAATAAHAQACAAALKAGEAPPACPVLPEVNSGPLTLALAHLAALDRAAGELDAEHDRAANAAGTAAARVAAIVDEIVFGEIHVLANEAVAAIKLHWKLVDRLKGLVMVDERRDGGPRFRAFQEAFLARIDRQKAAIACDPAMIERHRFLAYITDLAEQERRRWQDYRRRLASDPKATFDVDGGRA